MDTLIETSFNSERLVNMAQSAGMATIKIADYLERIEQMLLLLWEIGSKQLLLQLLPHIKIFVWPYHGRRSYRHY